jgi:hypothetical protein
MCTAKRHSRRPAGLGFLLMSFAAACASGSSGTSATARPATQTVGRGDIGTLVMAASGGSDVFKVSHSADAVWKVLPGVFDSLAIPVNTIDPATKEIGNSALKIRSRLGKVYLSRYLECGNTQLGPNADSYDVVLTVMARVTAEGTAASSISTTVQAQAKPATYNQGYNQCSSKGAIEKRLVDLVSAALSK